MSGYTTKAMDVPTLPLEDHHVRSSLGTPFMVVSSLTLVEDVGVPGEETHAVLMDEVMKYINELNEKEAVLIADFEGEMPGHGGELVTAAFLPTAAVDKDTLAQRPSDAEPIMPGLLIDLRCSSGVMALKEIMASKQMTKLIWGADADLQSLMFQDFPIPLNVQPDRIVDVQLAFSQPGRRLGMQRMLEERVPARFMSGLPCKEQIDFDAFHSKNRRAMALPLSLKHAAYAMDDLHRIEAILRSQKPPGGSYAEARRLTDITVQQVREDPLGLTSLKSEMTWFQKKTGLKKLVKAVEIKRHILAIRAKGQQDPSVVRAEAAVNPVIERAGVMIPADLSFSP